MFLKNLKIADLIFLPVIIICLILTTTIFSLNFNTPWQHFSDQSQGFLKGRLDIKPLDFDKHDYTIINGKYYWPQGPLPSVALMPFQLLAGEAFHQGFMQALLASILIVLLYILSLIKKFSPLDALYLTTVFLIGSPAVGILVDPKSWYYAQVLTVVLLTTLLLEFETKRRWWIIGILAACLLATRPTAGTIILMLVPFLIFQKHLHINKKLTGLTFLVLPIVVSILFLLWFNYARFGNPFDNGYYTNDVGGFIGPLRDEGVFSFKHIPRNIYYYFLISVDPIKEGTKLIFPYIKYSVWGLSFFLVAPFFLLSLKTLKYKDITIQAYWSIVIITLIIELSYYAPGWYQFGPRYTNDFMPIIFLLTLYSIESHSLNFSQKLIISMSCLFNIYLLITPLLFNIST